MRSIYLKTSHVVQHVKQTSVAFSNSFEGLDLPVDDDDKEATQTSESVCVGVQPPAANIFEHIDKRVSNQPRAADVSDSVGDRSPATGVYVGGKSPATEVQYKPHAAERGRPHAALPSVCDICNKQLPHDIEQCSVCNSNTLASPQVGLSGDAATDDVSDVSKSVKPIEVVSLSQFTRAGKRGHYESCGVITLRQPDAVPSSDEQQLNFTHRTAHGSSTNDADASVGKYASLANE